MNSTEIGGGDSNAVLTDSTSTNHQQLSEIEQEALDRKIRQGKGQEYVLNIINNCCKSGSVYLDLSTKNICSIPPELLAAPHVQVNFAVHCYE